MRQTQQFGAIPRSAEDLSVVVVGEQGVGKTTLVKLHTAAQKPENWNDYKPTEVLAFGRRENVELSNYRKVTLSTKEFSRDKRLLALSYCREAKGVIVVCDSSNQASFDSLPGWIESVRRESPEAEILLVLNNKITPSNPSCVTFADVKKLAEELRVAACIIDPRKDTQEIIDKKLDSFLIQASGGRVQASVSSTQPNISEAQAEAYLKHFHDIIKSEIFTEKHTRKNLFHSAARPPRTIMAMLAVLNDSTLSSSDKLIRIHALAKNAYNAHNVTQFFGYLFKGRSVYTNNFYGIIRNLDLRSLTSDGVDSALTSKLRPYESNSTAAPSERDRLIPQ